jgi:2-polyprenyl-3-methyl-5-hydroxy-6-metoxy-1,4-benzoquinol methylase
MNINKLIGPCQKPAIYTKGTKEMWIDPHISNLILSTHLDENIDLASRKGSTITKTVEWILDKAPNKKLRILDLGCGPGLYTEKFAQKGHQVKGVDYSKNSIDYAKGSAKEKSLKIDYEHKNYLLLDEEDKYDLVIMIFTDFGVLNPKDRETLLKNVKRALKPAGTFIIDVLNESYLNRLNVKGSETKSWGLEKAGFWKDEPYLVLNDSFLYEDEKVSMNQHIVIDSDGDSDIYRFWIHYFSNNDLKNLLEKSDFVNPVFFDDVLPDSDILKKNETTFCVCKKK